MQIRPDLGEKSVRSQANNARDLGQVNAKYAVKMATQIKAEFVPSGAYEHLSVS